MKNPALKFEHTDLIGRVASVDTSRVYITADDHSLVTRVSIGNLFAVAGSTEHEYLIGISERITRDIRETLLVQEEDAHGNLPAGQTQNDTIQLVLVGTFRTVDGSRRNVFKRGADSFPQIDRDCYLITAGNLQRLMNLLADDLPEEKRLQLGHFVADRSARAIADGNRFFQRHAAILGSCCRSRGSASSR